MLRAPMYCMIVASTCVGRMDVRWTSPRRMIRVICIARRRGSDAMKILVVDDHALIRDTIRGVLAELLEAALVLEAPDGEHGLRDHRPHLSGDYLRFIEQTAKGRLPCRIHHGGSAPQPCLR